VIVIEKDRWLLLLLPRRRQPEKEVGVLVGAPAHHPLPGARVNAASRQDQVKVYIVQAPVGQKMPPATGNQVLDHDRLLGLCAVERPVLSPKMGQLLLLSAAAAAAAAFAKDVEGAGGVGEVRQLCKQTNKQQQE
jgi:hypothetical protein